MNKERFMIELERLLRGLPVQEREDALNYYREYIEDAGFSEIDDVTDKLGTPKTVARSILGESVDKYVEVQKERKTVKSGASTLWRILLYICAAPFAIPIVAVAASLFIAVAAVIFSLEIAMICVGASFALAGFALIPVLFWSLTVPQLLLIGGMILILLPLGIIFCMVFYKAGAAMMGGFLRLMRKIFVKEER